MRGTLRFWYLILPLVLAACGKAPCDRDAAQHAGYQTALAGRAFSPPPDDTPACRLAGQQGWERGKAERCTPDRGWQDGAGGAAEATICAADANRPMSYRAAYRLAVEIKQREAERLALTAAGESADPLRIAALEQQLTDLRALAEQHGWLAPEALDSRLKAARKDSER